MTRWLAGMRITPTRLGDVTVSTETAGLVASSGFTVTSFSGRKAKGITSVAIVINRSGATVAELAPAGSGDLTETAICTLPVGWRPSETLNTIAGGANDSECRIATTGLISARSTSGSNGIVTGANLTISAEWIGEDDN